MYRRHAPDTSIGTAPDFCRCDPPEPDAPVQWSCEGTLGAGRPEPLWPGARRCGPICQALAVHLSQEYSPDIRVNALVPGFLLTEQNRFLLIEEGSGELTERGKRIIDPTPMARFGQPEDLVGPALWLLSSSSAFVHGSTVVVGGGLNAYGGV